MTEYIILGRDDCDAEEKLALWLKDHGGIEINRVHLQHEPPAPLTPLGGNVPRVSILIDYELSEVARLVSKPLSGFSSGMPAEAG
jgi:hypothetical protein